MLTYRERRIKEAKRQKRNSNIILGLYVLAFLSIGIVW